MENNTNPALAKFTIEEVRQAFSAHLEWYVLDLLNEEAYTLEEMQHDLRVLLGRVSP